MAQNIRRYSRRWLVRGWATIFCLTSSMFWVRAQHPSSESSDSMVHVDSIEDSLFDPISADPSCGTDEDCMIPPASTIETETILDATCFKGGEDHSTFEDERSQECMLQERVVDKHWGADPALKSMREQLQKQALKPLEDSRPPIFLLPGLASTRLVSWKLTKCTGMFGTEIKVQDNVWLNINLVIQMGTVNVQCMTECLRLGVNQSDTDDWTVGCKLRPDEGLDAIASLAPGSIGSSLLVGGTNTVYAWLIQWLADNLGYDVTNIIGLPYDWRLSPDKMEARDGFLSMTRRRIEAAVASNGGLPGIMVAHSMGNLVFRYFLDWLRVELREEAYQEYITRARRRQERQKKKANSNRHNKNDDPIEQGRLQESRNRVMDIPNPTEEQKPTGEVVVDNTPSPSEDQEVISSILPGWMAAAVPGFDNVLGWFTSQLLQEELKVEDPTATEKPIKSTSTDEETDKVDERVPNADSSNSKKDDDDNEKTRLQNETSEGEADDEARLAQFRELAIEEGDAKWLEWIEKHVWTYIGLSAPLLGAVNPLRAVISGENMGLPINDEMARYMEVTFGSTHTLNPISIGTGFCDQWDDNDWDADTNTGPSSGKENRLGGQESLRDKRLACLDDIMNDIEYSSVHRDPWKNFTALKSLLRDRMDWDTSKPMVDVQVELCQGPSGKKSCVEKETLKFGPKDVETGAIFDAFNSLWTEKGNPLLIKREQLEESFMNTKVANILNRTWERPHIKHVVMAYGVDVPTEVGYIYKKKLYSDDGTHGSNTTDGLPNLKAVIWEEPKGKIMMEPVDNSRGSLAEHFMKRKSKKEPFNGSQSSKGHLAHSGDGSVPYLSLSWVHTWLLHAARARRFGEEDGRIMPSKDTKNALDHISISHRPHGAIDWIDGPPPQEAEKVDPSKLVDTQDTGVNHPHGTRYKPLMTRFHNVGISRTTGIEYTTTVIEAVGVEHKETTRNYDILAAVFSDALKFMHDDLGLIGNATA